MKETDSGNPSSHSRRSTTRSTWAMDVCGKIESVEVANTSWSRIKGLLFRERDDVSLLLVPCHDVHTFGMRFPIDIAFISETGEVLKVHRNVVNMRRVRHKKASLVMERFSQNGDWLKEGDVIHIGVPK